LILVNAVRLVRPYIGQATGGAGVTSLLRTEGKFIERNIMSIRTLSLALLLGFSVSAALAQQAAAPTAAASSAQNCAKAPHDHGADRGTPSSKSGCKPAAKKDKVATTDKKAGVQGHDHGKVHKNQ
jgi:hypothetical protein